LVCDAVAVRNGRVVFIEFKAPGQKLANHQKSFGEQLKHEGIEYRVIRTREDCDLMMSNQ
jgi:hypothetical protein